MGAPLTTLVWDILASYTGDPQAYEHGGKASPPPAGYWIDLTEIARRYAWERLPSWINWRTFYPSIRYNQFVMTGGLDWNQAMAEIYPVEALQTATSVPTTTLTPTATPHRPAPHSLPPPSHRPLPKRPPHRYAIEAYDPFQRSVGYFESMAAASSGLFRPAQPVGAACLPGNLPPAASACSGASHSKHRSRQGAYPGDASGAGRQDTAAPEDGALPPSASPCPPPPGTDLPLAPPPV
jgi:hypothetical protein